MLKREYHFVRVISKTFLLRRQVQFVGYGFRIIHGSIIAAFMFEKDNSFR